MRRRSEQGFSLIEMLIVIVILVILGGISAPVFLRALRHYRMQAQVRGVGNLILRARYEAIRRNQLVSTVYEAPAVFGDMGRYGIDQNRNNVLDPGEPFVYTRSNTWVWSWTGPWDLGVLNYNDMQGTPTGGIGFTPDGRMMLQNGATWTPASKPWFVSLWWSAAADWQWAVVTVTPAGRIRFWRYYIENASWRSY